MRESARKYAAGFMGLGWFEDEVSRGRRLVRAEREREGGGVKKIWKFERAGGE